MEYEYLEKCPMCKTKFERTRKHFTGTCNYEKGQYIYFSYCPNEACYRYRLFCDVSTSENKN